MHSKICVRPFFLCQQNKSNRIERRNRETNFFQAFDSKDKQKKVKVCVLFTEEEEVAKHHKTEEKVKR